MVVRVCVCVVYRCAVMI